MDEILEAAEIHPISILQKAGDNRFIAFIECMFEIMQADHQPGGLAGTTLLGVEGTELVIKDRSVDPVGQNKQRMRPIQNRIETDPEQIGPISLSLFGLHKITMF